MKALEYADLGGPEQYRLVDRADPAPGPQQALIAVEAIGLNPVDVKISRGKISWAQITPPEGLGCDFAGTVAAVGAGSRWQVGDRVAGQARHRAAAECVAADDEALVALPRQVDAAVGAALPIPARTAWASVTSQPIGSGTTVLVSAAAGSVGIIAAQLAASRGARVLGTASPTHHPFLREVGVEPLDYRGNLAQTLHAAAPDGIDVVLDNQGDETVEAAMSLGVPAERINSVCAYRSIATLGIGNFGNEAGNMAAVSEVAGRIADGSLHLPRPRVFPLAQFRAAYELLLTGHGTGKIVLKPV